MCLNHTWTVQDEASNRSLDSVTYNRHITSLRRDYEKNKPSCESTLILMRETAVNRREWILRERPTVQTILTEFPYFKSYDVVSYNHLINYKQPLYFPPIYAWPIMSSKWVYFPHFSLDV